MGVDHMSGSAKRSGTDRYVTTCKQCRLGIFVGQPRAWQDRPAPGLIHTECAPAAPATT
jgi:hypothetical protein